MLLGLTFRYRTFASSIHWLPVSLLSIYTLRQTKHEFHQLKHWLKKKYACNDFYHGGIILQRTFSSSKVLSLDICRYGAVLWSPLEKIKDLGKATSTHKAIQAVPLRRYKGIRAFPVRSVGAYAQESVALLDVERTYINILRCCSHIHTKTTIFTFHFTPWDSKIFSERQEPSSRRSSSRYWREWDSVCNSMSGIWS